MSAQPTNAHDDSTDTTDDGIGLPSLFKKNFTTDLFDDFHRLNEKQRNKAEGYDDTRNDPSHTPDADTHSPSQLLNCHRMAYYDANNAPREDDLPHGIFKFGHDFESYIENFIENIIASEEDVTVENPVRVDYHVDDIHITGTTDPVLFRDGKPVALIEVKTTKNLYFVRRDGVREQHKAQAHAYARGLQEEYDLESPLPIFVIYGGREDLDTEIFELSGFDTDFWEDTVLDWAEEQTRLREQDELPDTLPSGSNKSYMCGYCDFQERCGNYEPDSTAPGEPDKPDIPSVYNILQDVQDGNIDIRDAKDLVEKAAEDVSIDAYWWNDDIDTSVQNTFEDEPVEGFLPLVKYPEDVVVSHLMTHDDVKLTPTLAVQHPDFVDNDIEPDARLETLYDEIPQREVHDWVCPDCGDTHGFGEVVWNGEFNNRPACSSCGTELRGPRPGGQ